MTRCVCQLIEIQAQQRPNGIAITFNNQILTYQELNERSNQVARYLQTFGVNTEVLVGVCVERSLEMVIALLGILKAGGAYVPLDPNYPRERLAFILEDTKLSILLSQKSLSNVIPQYPVQKIYLDEDWPKIVCQSRENFINPIAPHNLAYLIYTSGSTGRPKGVAIEHGSVFALIEWAKEFFTPEQLKGVLASTSLCFDLSIFEIFVTLSCGGKVIVARNALELPTLPTAQEVTLINTVPSAIAELLRMNGIPSSVRTINLAGEPLQNFLVQKIYQLNHIQEVFNLYGPSEDTTYSTVAFVEKGSTEIPSIGRPIANTQIYLLDSHLNPVPLGEVGEIYISGAGVARGYWNCPELTAEKFIANPFSHDSKSRLYKTGDLASYLPNGNLRFLGRKDYQVKIRGFRIELGEIENAIAQHPKIQETIVIAKENSSKRQYLIAYIVGQCNKITSDTEQVRHWDRVWNNTYQFKTPSHQDHWFNSNGYNSSYTGLPIASEEMREWVADTSTKILELQPQKVLEIGCGMGLILFRVAPYCSDYYGIDISQTAIAQIEAQIERDRQRWEGVRVKQGKAHELDRLEVDAFDTIIINSVIQYFPSLDYLLQVLKEAIARVKPGGKIFIGDIRSLPLLEAFHTSVQLARSPASLSTIQLQQRIQERIEADGELVIHPDFFLALKTHFPQISFVETSLKGGLSQNELISFRYDIVLHIGATIATTPAPQVFFDWQQQNWSVPSMLHWLKQNCLDIVKIENIPNVRIIPDLQAVQLLHNRDRPKTVAELRSRLVSERPKIKVHPETWWKLGILLDYQIDLNWSKSKERGCYDVVLRKKDIPPLPQPTDAIKPLQEYISNPAQIATKQNLIPELREFLQIKLPHYMIPSIFVVLDSLPLTPNGKIDRQALPEPQRTRPLLDKTFVAPETEIERKLAEIWSQLLAIKEIGTNDTFAELGGHSLLTVQLLARIEEVFQIEIPLITFLQYPTIAGLSDMLSGDRPKAEFSIDIHQDTVLDSTIYPSTYSVDPEKEPQHIFLTGVTGFVGAFLLQELLEQTDAKIYCLIRASQLEEGKSRLQQNLKRYLLWKQTWDSRLIPVVGDLSKPMFGMEAQNFRDLANKVDLIYHCGAFINLIYPYPVLRKPNVLGTREILRLAGQGTTTPVHFISTLDVFLSPHYTQQSVLYEEEAIAYPEQLSNGYAQSKWVAEQLMLNARDRGIPASIYRLPMISGHSQTGIANNDDLLSRFIMGILQLGSAPMLARSIGMVPVDFVSKAIFNLSRQPESLGKVFHFGNDRPLAFPHFVETLRDMGYNIKEIAYPEWLHQLQQPELSRDNVLNPLAKLFSKRNNSELTYLETTLLSNQRIDCQNTQIGLRGTGIICPPVDSELIKTYMSHLHQNEVIARLYRRFARGIKPSLSL
ncbi:amino acid adenylation domain-containing protein [Spirulina sp. 06S082]|uniref:amino acid adenylation domain-containing protein n=1 Tax=Spirulina sp. 06S082 TaxID=3110248 RepID=UPI002B2023E6|nr:amino acid adenylation domain-containing protein [Spirulina sp. 06S082]MEA5471077.1 amino acid adenylation domain-containing protein [Spirulina sp. 06S082]